MTRVKICGITCLEDAVDAVEAGADAIGFVFADGPRKVKPENVRKIICRMPPFVKTVGIFVGNDPNAEKIAEDCPLDIIQVHTGYTSEYVHGLRHKRLILGVRVCNEMSFNSVPGIEFASALLLDAYQQGTAGGTGVAFDWSLASAAAGLNKPIVLAGGLNPDNVADAIRQVKPYAVDVSSGVEMSPGKKDREKVRLFIERARHAYCS